MNNENSTRSDLFSDIYCISRLFNIQSIKLCLCWVFESLFVGKKFVLDYRYTSFVHVDMGLNNGFYEQRILLYSKLFLHCVWCFNVVLFSQNLYQYLLYIRLFMELDFVQNSSNQHNRLRYFHFSFFMDFAWTDLKQITFSGSDSRDFKFQNSTRFRWF